MITPDTLWTDARLVVCDIEGNGASPPDVVELAVLSIEGGAVAEKPTAWLVKPSQRITWHAKKVHGIGNKDVENCPSFADIASDVIEAIGTDAVIVAHNASTELRLLCDGRLGLWRPTGVIDTLAMARQILPNQSSHKLSALVEELELTPLTTDTDSQAHRADWDVMVTAQLLVRLIDSFSSPPTLKELLHEKLTARFSKPPPPAQGNLF